MSLISEDAHAAKGCKSWWKQFKLEKDLMEKEKLIDELDIMFTELFDNINNLYDADEEKVKLWRKKRGGY